jgi:hypothetical protein
MVSDGDWKSRNPAAQQAERAGYQHSTEFPCTGNDTITVNYKQKAKD